MTTFSDMLYHLGGMPVGLGIPYGPDSRYFWVDPDNGSDDNNGTKPSQAKASLAAAYALMRTNKHDATLFIGGNNADVPTATLAWTKNFAHLVGLSGNIPGSGQRCRVEAQAGNDMTEVVTFSGKGCAINNMQFTNLSDADVDSGSTVVSGGRNTFRNCFFAGMGHATPGARAGSYSLTLSGSENHFERCTVGLDTIVRAAANAELVVSGGARNRFWDCDFTSASETAGKFAVQISNMDRWIEFKDCLFHNFSVNWGQALTDAFNISAAATHYVILRGACQFVGYTGIADVVTHIYGAGPAPNAGMFLSTQPTT